MILLLLYGTLNQKKEYHSEIYVKIQAMLIAPERVKAFKKQIAEGHFHDHLPSFYVTYAGEINWSDFLKPDESDYYEKVWGLQSLLNEYSWSSYADERFKHPHFKFLDQKFSGSLDFDPSLASFRDKNGNQVTQLLWTDDAQLFYIKRAELEKIIASINTELVYYEFISKTDFTKPDDYSADAHAYSENLLRYSKL